MVRDQSKDHGLQTTTLTTMVRAESRSHVQEETSSQCHSQVAIVV